MNDIPTSKLARDPRIDPRLKALFAWPDRPPVGDIASREDLVRVLLPVLPVQYQPALQHEDLTARLQKRIADIAPQAAHSILDLEVPVSEAVRLLGERP